MMSRLEELKFREDNLRVKVIDNPNLPQTMQELQDKANALEIEMQESRSKIYQIDRDISQYKQLHEVIERQLISVCKECHSYLQQISQSKFDLTVGFFYFFHIRYSCLFIVRYCTILTYRGQEI